MNCSSNNKVGTKTPNGEKKIIINKAYFSLDFVPYDKILFNLLSFLQKKVSLILFNEIYKLFVTQIKKHIKANISSSIMSNKKIVNKTKEDILDRSNINSINNNKKQIISEFCYNNSNIENTKKKTFNKIKTKTNLKKYIHPFIDFSYSQKLRYNILNPNELRSFKRNTSNNISRLEDKDLVSFIINSNNISKIKNPQKMKTNNNTNDNSNNTTKIEGKNDYKFFKNFLNNKYKFNTINTTLHNNSKNKITKISNKKQKPKTKKPALDMNYTLPHMAINRYINTVKLNQKNINNLKIRTNSNLKNIKNAVVINNTFFNKYKNNYNFGVIQNKNKKIKVINIKINDKEKKGNMKILNQAQNSEEMLDKIKNSLDDDNFREKLASFEYEGCHICNIDMESASITGLAALLGHRAISCCIVDDVKQNSLLGENNSFKELVRIVLDRI